MCVGCGESQSGSRVLVVPFTFLTGALRSPSLCHFHAIHPQIKFHMSAKCNEAEAVIRVTTQVARDTLSGGGNSGAKHDDDRQVCAMVASELMSTEFRTLTKLKLSISRAKRPQKRKKGERQPRDQITIVIGLGGVARPSKPRSLA